MQTKYVVVVGSLMSGMGKGGVTASLLKMLQLHGYNAFPLKFDGYLNYDCGTMNPFRHGEVFVLDDKSEVDMDFGMYERFLNKDLSNALSITGGKLFSRIIEKERRGGYLGQDVQMIPHLTNEIIGMVEEAAKKKRADVLVVEVGGTVGDLENGYFIEAMRQMAAKHEVVFINLTYVPVVDAVGEQKTKPAQLGIRGLLQLGIRPDFLVCRSEKPLEGRAVEKLALYAGMPREHVIDDSTQHTVYALPLHFMKQHLDTMLLGKLGLKRGRINARQLDAWKSLVSRIDNQDRQVRVAIVGKYVYLKDSYVSVKEALVHACALNNVRLEVDWIESEELEKGKHSPERLLGNADALIVPGGFGKRGIEGMITAIRYAREHRIPFLGLCLGMQLMVVEYARDVCGLTDANSSEFEPNARHKVIALMEEQRGIRKKGGTMRLGDWAARVKAGTIMRNAYKAGVVHERHRHRYEFNNKYKAPMQRKGLVISATTLDGSLVESTEWCDSFGIGTQAHPELKSRLERPAPLFAELVRRAALRERL